MKTISSPFIRRSAFILAVGIAGLSLVLITTPSNAQDDKVPASFKVPSGYMRVEMSRFRGVMMIEQKASGMFVTYPDDNETAEALRQRILAFVAPMFIHDEKGKPKPGITWDTKSLPSHPGDGDGKAAASVFNGGDYEMQVAIYERTTGPRPLLYGYFAMRHKSGKDDDGRFLDEQGQGVKAFDKLWKSFPK